MPYMPKLDSIILNVLNTNRQVKFYCNVLGMTDKGNNRVGYDDQEAFLEFRTADLPYEPQQSDTYWKIAISVPNT